MELEELLKKAATEPAYRAEFYDRLLNSDLFVLTHGSDIPEGEHTLNEAASVSMVSFEDGKIPVFTSTERIFDKQVIDHQVDYLAMKGRDLFTTVRGATLILNPFSDFGKELLPDELERVLNGTIIFGSAQTITMEKSTEVLLGQPAIVPDEMLHSLKLLFATKSGIRAAYLGWIHDAKSNIPPHYVIGVETEGEASELIREAGFTAQQHLKPGEFVDFLTVDESDGVSGYLRGTEPFYRR